MKKLLKWLLGLVVVLVLLVVLAIILLPLVFDPNEHKPRIQQMAAESIGREVVLNGAIEWSVFPWVAINLNDVSIANESGFKGEYLASVAQVSARVKLLPLLKKQIQVGQIELKKPDIKLQVAQSGNSNWQSILDYLEQGSESPSSESGSTDLEIRGVSLTDGILTYTDAAADLQINMDGLSFFSEAIKADTPTQMSLQSGLNIPDQELAGQLSAEWLTEGITGNGGLELLFDQLAFNGQSAGVPIKIVNKGPAAVDLAQDSLSFDDMTINYGVLKINTPISGRDLSGQLVLNGQMNIDEFALNELLTSMGSPLKNQANNEMSGQLAWSLVGDRLQFSNIALKLDDSNISGDVDIRQLSQLRGQFNLGIDQLNLDLYLPESEDQAKSSSNETSTTMNLGQLQGQITMNQLQAAGVQLSDITLNIRTEGEALTVEPLNAGFYQGLIKTELHLQPGKATEKLQISHQMQDFQAGGLLTDLMGTDYLTGLGQLSADIRVDEPFSERPLKSANGNISYQLTDGDIVGIDVFEIMQRSLSLMNKVEAAQSNSELKTAFGLMDIQADVRNGVLKTNKLRLTSPYFDLKGQVEIDLDQQTIKGSIKPMLTNIPDDVLDKNLAKLINIRIPVSLSGDLLEPGVSIDVAQLILESQKAKIDEKKDELKEDLFDALLGNKKDKKETRPDNEQSNAVDQQPEMTDEQKKRAEKDRRKKALLEGLFNSINDKNEDKGDQKDDSDGDN